MMAMRIRVTGLLTSVLVATAIVAPPVPAEAAADGVDVTITRLPEAFEAGADARTVEVVASTKEGSDRDSDERRCRKVRWSMLLQVDGPGLEQVRVDRIEEDGSFPMRVRTEGDTARLTDVRLDPGRLCRGQTVTARYLVGFAGDAPSGEVRFEVQAFDGRNELLGAASGTSRVAGAESTTSESGEAVAEAQPTPEPSRPVRSAVSGTRGLLGPGLIVGAMLVFVGVGLLLRIRMRNRGPTVG